MKIRIPSRSYFDRTHKVVGPMDMGVLYPVCCDEVYPGDSFRDRTESMVRLEAMIKPTMHEYNIFFHWFYVRDWTIMDDFEDMIFAGADGESTSVVPFNEDQVTIAEGDLLDWLGCNPGVYAADYFSMLPVRCYNKIYNDWYRNQNTESTEVSLDSLDLQHRCWERDYFTGGMPWAQRGPVVALPLGTTAPVIGNGKVLGLWTSDGTNNYPGYGLSTSTWTGAGGSLIAAKNAAGNNVGIDLSTVDNLAEFAPRRGVGVSTYASSSGLVADLTHATAATFDSWMVACQIQAWQRMNGIAGVRYVEGVKAHFGVNTPDARVERAEYLGGGKSPIVISEVLQTSSTDSTTPQGNLAGHGIGANVTNGFKRTFTEHGFLMCICSIMPRTSYQQGFDPMFFRKTHLDFMTPEFSRLGFRPVPVKYLYTGAYLDSNGDVVSPTASGATWTPVTDPDKTFNYQAIYNELRYKPSSVHGTMRSSESYWTGSRIFSTEPQFNDEFVKCTPSKRMFAVQSDDYPVCKVEIVHHLDCFRELPKDGMPWSF